jgi:hypothetical protein
MFYVKSTVVISSYAAVATPKLKLELQNLNFRQLHLNVATVIPPWLGRHFLVARGEREVGNLPILPLPLNPYQFAF